MTARSRWPSRFTGANLPAVVLGPISVRRSRVTWDLSMLIEHAGSAPTAAKRAARPTRMRPRPALVSPKRLWPLTKGTGSRSRLHVLPASSPTPTWRCAAARVVRPGLAGARRTAARDHREIGAKPALSRCGVFGGCVILGSFVSVLPPWAASARVATTTWLTLTPHPCARGKPTLLPGGRHSGSPPFSCQTGVTAGALSATRVWH
jgi:hypothetical protein